MILWRSANLVSFRVWALLFNNQLTLLVPTCKLVGAATVCRSWLLRAYPEACLLLFQQEVTPHVLCAGSKTTHRTKYKMCLLAAVCIAPPPMTCRRYYVANVIWLGKGRHGQEGVAPKRVHGCCRMLELPEDAVQSVTNHKMVTRDCGQEATGSLTKHQTCGISEFSFEVCMRCVTIRISSNLSTHRSSSSMGRSTSDGTCSSGYMRSLHAT
jgi:hypothetical protein